MSDDERDDDADREAILARRNKLIAVALAGLTSACGSSTCLRPLSDAGSRVDAGPADSGMDAEPVPCLSPPLRDDAGSDASAPDASDDLDGSIDTDAEPMACLRMAPPPDGGDGDASA